MTDPIEAQYTRWVYPAPAQSLRRLWQNCDPQLHGLHHAYWPDRDYWPGMRILVAGCGSNQAANIAYRNPDAEVLGIDVSPTSLAHGALLRDKHRLSRLRLEQRSIESLDTLDESFDLVIATGVLHHLSDPAGALRLLGSKLAPHGVIAVMLYGRWFRTGVVMLQELFRQLGLGQTPADVATVRQTLATLQADHPVRAYLRAVEDLGSDAGIVDTFLHVADRTYDVADCLALVEAAGLRFQGWQENFYYHPNGQLPGDHPLFARLDALPPPAMWSAMELHHGGIGRHDFFCCRTDRPREGFELDFAREGFLTLVPVRRVTRLVPADASRGTPAAIGRPPLPDVPLDAAKARLFDQIDGHRSVAQCLADAGIAAPSRAALEDFARQFFTSLWRLGYVHLRLGPTRRRATPIAPGDS